VWAVWGSCSFLSSLCTQCDGKDTQFVRKTRKIDTPLPSDFRWLLVRHQENSHLLVSRGQQSNIELEPHWLRVSIKSILRVSTCQCQLVSIKKSDLDKSRTDPSVLVDNRLIWLCLWKFEVEGEVKSVKILGSIIYLSKNLQKEKPQKIQERSDRQPLVTLF